MSNAISVTNLSKRFRLPLDRSSTLKYRATHWRSASRYRDFYALEDVTFDVPEGQFLGIAGPNGCGKSTLLKILSRIYEPNSGKVRIDGDVSSFLELGVGFNPELTARENIFLGGAVLGLTHSQLRDRLDAILHFADLEEFADQKLKNYSSGMQVRLAFTVAITARAEVLLMDEVLAVGDARFQEKCFDVFARLKREGRTIVLVSHDLATMDHYCDRLLLIDHGRVIDDGHPAKVAANYRRIVGAEQEQADLDDLGTTELPDAAPDSGPEQRHRWGSRELVVLRVAMADESGKDRRSFSTGRPAGISIDYEIRVDVGEFVCLIAVRRDDGLLIAGPNSKFDGLQIAGGPPGSRGSITYATRSLSLLSGTYMVALGLYDRHATHPYDYIEEALTFRVVDDRGRAGIVDLDGRWSTTVTNAEAAGGETQSTSTGWAGF
jgi:lipopolysaccharide transport system ATP-binding protein